MVNIKQTIKARLDNGQELVKSIFYFLVIYDRNEIAEKRITFKQNNGDHESTIKSTFNRIRLSFEEGKYILEVKEKIEDDDETLSETFSTVSINQLGNGQISKEVWINETNKQGGWQKLDLSFNQIDIEVQKQSPTGKIDEIGIEWLIARGEIAKIEMSRNDPTDDRWSGNVSGIADGFEATMIAKSIEISRGGHFNMKHGGGNHKGEGSQKWRWYDTGLRHNGAIQLQREEPHHKNFDFDLPENKQFIKNIGKDLEGNWIGLKWCLQNLKTGGSISDGGIHCRMWVDTDPLDENNKPKNNWDLVYDFVDGENDGDEKVMKNRNYKMPDTMDMEVRRSDTEKHEIYSEGKIVKITKEAQTDEELEDEKFIGLYVRKL